MKATPTKIPDVWLLEPEVFGDERGFFLESYNKKVFQEQLGINPNFVQDNHSRSRKNVLRGLHYQIKQPQGKLVRVVLGTIYDVAVDLRKSSPTFQQWVGVELSSESKGQLWVPEGFAHGFLVLSQFAEVLYKTTDYYKSQQERSLLWNDPDLAISWPLKEEPLLSTKDKAGQTLQEAEVFE